MTTSMPAPSTNFDPTLTLGNIVNHRRVKYIQKVAEIERPQILAQKRMDEMVMSHSKLQMVNDQMINMEVSPKDMKDFQGETKKMKRGMARAALVFAKATIKLQQNLSALDAKLAGYGTTVFDTKSIESPIDRENSVLQKSPVAPESMSMDVQYFRNETNRQGVSTLPFTLSRFISSKFLSWSSSAPVAHKLSKETFNLTLTQTQNHALQGTLVICANCTHKQADIYEPLVLDPDKAITAWNKMFPNDKLKRNKKSIVTAAIAAATKPTKAEKSLCILSGLTRGSSFVGLVHILNDKNENLSSKAKSLSNQLEKGQKAKDDFATQSKVAKKAMNLLSRSTVMSHCSLVTEGLISEIKTNSLTTDVQSLKADPEDMMKQLAAIMNATDNNNADGDDKATKKAKAQQKAQMHAHVTKLNSEHLKNVVACLGERYQNENKLFDADNLMSSFTDFITNAKEGEAGIPLTYYFKLFTKSNIAKAYEEKFFPEAMKEDDEEEGKEDDDEGKEDDDEGKEDDDEGKEDDDEGKEDDDDDGGEEKKDGGE